MNTIQTKIKTYILVAFAAFALAACGGKTSQEQHEKANSDTPPSISGVKAADLVRLTDKEFAELKIQSQPVASAIQKYRIAVPGVVFPAPNHISIISTPINGRISKIEIQEGQSVRTGQELFCIESLEFGNMVSEYLQAVSEEIGRASCRERV